MLDFIERKIKLVVMRLSLGTELSPSVGKDTSQTHILFGKERQHTAVKQISRGIDVLAVYSLAAPYVE